MSKNTAQLDQRISDRSTLATLRLQQSATTQAWKELDGELFTLSGQITRIDQAYKRDRGYNSDTAEQKHKNMLTRRTEIEASMDALAKKNDELDAQIKGLEAQVDVVVPITLADLKDAKAPILEAQTLVDDLTGRIEAAQAFIATAASQKQGDESITRRREDLAAQVMSGHADPQDLVAFDKETEKARQQFETEYGSKASLAKAAIPGLQRRINEAQQPLKEAQTRLNELTIAYVESESVKALAAMEPALKAMQQAYAPAA